MSDIVQDLRAAAAVLLDCPEHVPIDGGKILVNLHKRADEINAAADEIERLRLTAKELAAIKHIVDGGPENIPADIPHHESLRGLLDRLGSE